MVDIIHRVGIKAPLSKVYAAIATLEGVKGWWAEDTSGSAAVGGITKSIFMGADGKPMGEASWEVLSLDTNKKVKWAFRTGPEDWIGTNVTYDLSTDGDYSIVIFGHRGWKEASESMAHCSMKWAIFMMSLKHLVENGKGEPSPHDVKIDSWN